MKSNNLQTIYVMWLREMKRFFRAKARVIGTLAMPFFSHLFWFWSEAGIFFAGNAPN